MYSLSLRHLRTVIPFTAVLLAACSSGESDEPFDPLQFQARTGVIFVTLNVVQVAVMEALFEGRVITDAAGCLRFDSPDPATIVWPKGFTISESAGTMIVRDDAGRQIGQIGGSFRLGGGEVSWVHEDMSATDRDRLVTSCPGKYWIVGDVP